MKKLSIYCVILSVVLMFPVFGASQEGLLSYKNPEANFTFDYHENWEIVYEELFIP